MGWPLGPVVTTDNYPGTVAPGAAILRTPVVARLDLWVSNQPVYYQLLQVPPSKNPNAGTWGIDQYIPCATGQTVFVSLDRLCCGIRFKSAVSGKPSTITVELLMADEIPDGGSG